MKITRVFLIVAISVLFINTGQAQSVKNVKKVKNVVSTVTGYFKDFDITGTWVYEGVDVEFQTKDLLKKAGGSIAASRMEKSINEQLNKLGFKPGLTVLKFEEDGTFTNTTSGKTLRGTYTMDKKAETITMNYLGHIPMTATLSGTTTKLSLLFPADGFLSIFTFLGSKSGIPVLGSISSMLSSFDGMMVGMKLLKQDRKSVV